MNYPRHLGIIPDGNRTRAKQHWYPQIVWHKTWYDNATQLMDFCASETDIEVITMRWASTENIIKRSPEELEYLYDIYRMIDEKLIQIHQQFWIGFKRLGSSVWLPDNLVEFFHQKEQNYQSKDWRYFILAVNYGGNDEIIRWVNTLLRQNPWLNEISPEQLSKAMDLGDFPPIELIIRTKGKFAKRLSWFMTRRMSYAEIYFSDLHFPDFTPQELQKALIRFDSIAQRRNRGK